uniref:Peptidase M10 metallopeptidase domain-containing protein n=1 Tax=Acrobeloides nanus TaxID=290746 RepID=A0A914CB23_9BILA
MSGNFIDLNKIALHEIGHHLGIPDDYGRWGSVMHTDFKPYYDKLGNYIRPILGPDDIENAQRLYGVRNVVGEPFRKS